MIEVLGEALAIVFRFIVWLVVELILEILLRGPGYLVRKPFDRNAQPDDGWTLVAGILFWLSMIALIVVLFRVFEMDSCLDAGGSYDQSKNSCQQ